MMRFIPYILYLLLIAFYRTNLIDVFSIDAVQIYLTALIVLLVALNKDYLTTVWFGFAAGLIYDAPDPSHLGVHMLMLVFIGAAASHAKERLNLESIKSRLLLVIAGLFVYSVPYTLIYATSGTGEFFRLLIQVAIPSVIYSVIVGWLYFIIQTGRLSFERLKSIF
jgi:rod shape-determining protein MreD